MRDVSERLDTVRQPRLLPTRSGENEPKLRTGRAEAREGLEQPRVVLVRPRPGGVVEERLARDGGSGREPLVVDAEVDGVHAIGVEPEPLDDAALHPLADHDDMRRAACRPVVREPPKEPLAAGE